MALSIISEISSRGRIIGPEALRAAISSLTGIAGARGRRWRIIAARVRIAVAVVARPITIVIMRIIIRCYQRPADDRAHGKSGGWTPPSPPHRLDGCRNGISNRDTVRHRGRRSGTGNRRYSGREKRDRRGFSHRSQHISASGLDFLMHRDLVGNYDHIRSTYGVLRWKRHELMVFRGAKSICKNCAEPGVAPGLRPTLDRRSARGQFYRALTL